MATLNKLTKAELLAHIAAQDKLIRAQALDIEALRTKAAQAVLPAACYQAPAATHKAYYQYVARCKEVARMRGQRVASYKTFGDWSESVTGMSGVTGVTGVTA